MESSNKAGAVIAAVFMAITAIAGAVCGAGVAAAFLLR